MEKNVPNPVWRLASPRAVVVIVIVVVVVAAVEAGRGHLLLPRAGEPVCGGIVAVSIVESTRGMRRGRRGLGDAVVAVAALLGELADGVDDRQGLHARLLHLFFSNCHPSMFF